ncbi:MAG TPA: hypothetical protein VKB46_11135 [Pyrinomonadaceae bacterium]|nr:hypothetical protein [Pyrinomonadaceae bacterium]
MKTAGTRGFAAYLAESLWLSVDAPQFIGGYAAEAQPHEIFDTRGKPQAFRKVGGKADGLF